MERQRYELTLRCGSTDSVFWTNQLDEVQPIITLACSGAQADQNMALAVRDTVTRARAECASATSVGFNAMCHALLNSIDAAQPRPARKGEGHDVVVEFQFAAHDVPLERCRAWAEEILADALHRHAETAQETANPVLFSFNGPTAGAAWFQ